MKKVLVLFAGILLSLGSMSSVTAGDIDPDPQYTASPALTEQDEEQRMKQGKKGIVRKVWKMERQRNSLLNELQRLAPDSDQAFLVRQQLDRLPSSEVTRLLKQKFRKKKHSWKKVRIDPDPVFPGSGGITYRSVEECPLIFRGGKKLRCHEQ